MAALPLHADLKKALAVADQPLTCRNLTKRRTGQVVDRIDLFDREPLKNPLFDHSLCAKPMLFVRLKQKHYRAVKITASGKEFRRPQKHRHMPIMAASMHDTFVFRRVIMG